MLHLTNFVFNNALTRQEHAEKSYEDLFDLQKLDLDFQSTELNRFIAREMLCTDYIIDVYGCLSCLHTFGFSFHFG